MNSRIRRGISTMLFLCLVICAFYLREASQPEYMRLPVTQVISVVEEKSYRADRDRRRSEEMTALTALAQTGDAQAGAYLKTLVERSEKELAVESALESMGYATAVCAVREGAVMVCVEAALDASCAQRIIEVCEKITGECAENVFILDEKRYS